MLSRKMFNGLSFLQMHLLKILIGTLQLIGILCVIQMKLKAEIKKKFLSDAQILPFNIFQVTVNSNQAKIHTTALFLFFTHPITFPQNLISLGEGTERT